MDLVLDDTGGGGNVGHGGEDGGRVRRVQLEEVAVALAISPEQRRSVV